jgi:hypothetical protein
MSHNIVDPNPKNHIGITTVVIDCLECCNYMINKTES